MVDDFSQDKIERPGLNFATIAHILRKMYQMTQYSTDGSRVTHLQQEPILRYQIMKLTEAFPINYQRCFVANGVGTRPLLALWRMLTTIIAMDDNKTRILTLAKYFIILAESVELTDQDHLMLDPKSITITYTVNIYNLALVELSLEHVLVE